MELRQVNPESIRKNDGMNAGGRMRIDSDVEVSMMPGLVPILDIDVLDDEEFEPDGVNDFVRDFGTRDSLDDF